ncbi:multifunctional CCA tRNA nucleotidyl transferase/2'3'-cyclic phosphodiesterase/2'nucleotidase/phosphatase [Vibrio sp. D431a]|uniref:multifunctional CCA tRNA nucleotidyl transferase/2'3'-cyclic phosphodiesterase/2'nucleotidase/phosphatase n=1 Tax=Vibrio sp. D431a TaxID=2837388 RepID=UPI002554EFE8|nr:multifunctional CCA tRNA nucleotidyl transferase/2'3'-cyclic phosphodiesterase/2'nucleotidase/phosphatase [Vibrio sp. D431a]MDK9790128.1 multifunctional CCA tRNA nucleotidyl transferase/2'3'-cyclic phosphodiesterase/2'nucleotidase/phosphatase [Vibrio sp. D431a]
MFKKVYLVGGAVRDTLLGKSPKDLDYVVVGETFDTMRALNFKEVGKNFPVFHHPETQDEYALARREKKVGVGYGGFDFEFGTDVTLEEDLYRRDLTINSMAKDIETGEIIDPYNGRADLENKVLRHTNTKAFAEDPLRVLRLARFAAQLGEEWTIHEDTKALLPAASKEIEHLSAQRIWEEMNKALHSANPWIFFKVLTGLGVFSEIDEMVGIPQRKDYHPEGDVYVHTGMVVEYASKTFNNPVLTFGALCHDFGKAHCHRKYGKLAGHDEEGIPFVEEFCRKFKVPNEFRDFAVLATKYHQKLHYGLEMKPSSILRLFKDTGALRGDVGRQRFELLLKAGECDSRGRGEPFNTMDTPELDHLKNCLDAVFAVDTKVISERLLKEGVKGHVIGEHIHKAQLEVIKVLC